MNEIKEIKKIIENFVCESTQLKMQISKIESKRMELAQERNVKKQSNVSNDLNEVDKLGKEISRLGNESQKLQNKLNSKFNEIKNIVNLTIDNLVTDGIRKLNKIEEEKKEIEERIYIKKQKDFKYETQKREFYERFGRMPEVSESFRKKHEIQTNQYTLDKKRINEIEKNITDTEERLVELASIKRNFRDKKLSNIIEKQKDEKSEEESIVLPLMNEEFQVEELDTIENMEVAAFEPEEKFEIGEIDIEPVGNIEKVVKYNENTEENEVDEIEKLARSIVEEIVAEQTRDLNISNNSNEIKSLRDEQVKESTKEDIEEVNILDIVAKIEDGEIVYKAHISNGEEIKVYPTLEATNIILNDKEYREAINSFLMDYITDEYKVLDNSVIKKLDPTICEIIERFSQKYNFDEGDLMYNYAMSFSQNGYFKTENTIPITYNLSYLKYTNLSKIEKNVMRKICKNSLNNKSIDIIGTITGFDKIRYMFKKLFNINSIKALTDGKYE